MIDWKKSTPLLIATILCLSFFIYQGVNNFILRSHLENFQLSINDLKNQTIIAIDNQDKLKVYEPALTSLEERGFLGKPNRLQWVESIKNIAQKYDIPQIKFTLSPTVNLSSLNEDADFIDSRSHLFLTSMKLEIELTHEIEFYQIITSLKEDSIGIFEIDDCTIERKNSSQNQSESLLSSVCNLTWINHNDVRELWESDNESY